MKPSKRIWLPILLIVAVLATSAPAGTVDEYRRSIGWQTEIAAVVVIGEVRARVIDENEHGIHRGVVRVIERLKGPEDLPAGVAIIWTGEEGPAVADGRRAIFFLRTVPADRQPAGVAYEAYSLVTGAFGAVAVGESPDDPVTGFVRARLALVGRGAELAEIRKHFLEGIVSKSPVVVASAALDFGRTDGIEKGISSEDVAAIVAAFRAHRRPDRTRTALAVALGATRRAAAIPPLAECVIAGEARPLRGEIGESLARIGDQAAVAALEPGMKSERAAVRADAVNVLGRAGLAAGSAVVEKALTDPSGEVRLEAALAVGEMARALRAKKEDPPAAEKALAEALAAAKDVREKKAILWSAAQLDTQQGYDLVRSVAADDKDAALRKFARRVLENPRRRIVL